MLYAKFTATEMSPEAMNSSTFFPGFVGKIQSSYTDNSDKQSDTQKNEDKENSN